MESRALTFDFFCRTQLHFGLAGFTDIVLAAWNLCAVAAARLPGMRRSTTSALIACFFSLAFFIPRLVHAVQPTPGILPGGSVETTFLPAGDLFKPLLADLKEPRFYLSYRRYSYQNKDINAAAGGYGQIFGLYRNCDRERGTAWQVNLGGGIHSQFNMDAPSFALVNTDYTIGFPVTYRRGQDSFRVALYHQSSHLGDEFLLQTKANREELSYEAINFIASREWSEWRLYGGGEYLIHKVLSDLKPLGTEAGIEYYSFDKTIGRGRIVGGLDLKSDEEHDWALNASMKAGLQFDSSEDSGRYIRVLFEGYRGFAPHGQFDLNRIGF